MGRCGNELIWRIALLGLLGLGSMSTVIASPPAAHKGSVHLDRHLDLDLHPPAAASMAGEKKPSEAFPSPLHRHSLGAQESFDLPSMGTQSRPPNRVQELARRVRREGLPVARLWENQAALVSLGLNNKGKPGLWVIQKIH
jgi:hypothetical protein